MRIFSTNRFQLPLVLLVLAACGEPVGSPALTAPEAPLAASTTYGATLLECPVETTRSASVTIGLTGGVLELRGHKLVVPAGAVLAPTEFTLTEPASNYVEVDIRADGEEHFEFQEPVSLTLSYDRCTRSNIDKKSLRIYYIDGASKEILEDLGGTDDPEARTVTTSTDHLSDYAIGAP